MRSSIFALLIVLLLNGCSILCPTDELFLREVRSSLHESIRPALVNALQNAKDENGDPLYIDAYRDEKVHLLDEMISATDRIYPVVDDEGNPVIYQPEPLPWKQEDPQ